MGRFGTEAVAHPHGITIGQEDQALERVVTGTEGSRVDEANRAAEPTTPFFDGALGHPGDETTEFDKAIAEGELSLPSNFGRFEVERRIGVGGFASVYAAVDPDLKGKVAIKVLAENHSADIEVRKRFVAEARVARRMGSDRLIGVFDLGETDDGRPYVVMELADRGTLRSRLTRIGQPSADSLRRLISELGACMAAIHDKGVVHRDIKPTNLLLRSVSGESDIIPLHLIEDDERLLLADFGLARDISAGASAITVGGGTVGYMAPEQADPRGKADYRADIYAATVVLAEMSTGRHPERLDLGSSQLTEAQRRAIGRGLSMDRELRPASAGEWQAELLAAFAPSQDATTTIAPGGDRQDQLDASSETVAPTAVYPQSGLDQAGVLHVPADPAAKTAIADTTENRPNANDATHVLDVTHVQVPYPHDGADVLDDDSFAEIEPRTYVGEAPDDETPPPPPPSIPLNPDLQRPVPNRVPEHARQPWREKPADPAKPPPPRPSDLVTPPAPVARTEEPGSRPPQAEPATTPPPPGPTGWAPTVRAYVEATQRAQQIERQEAAQQRTGPGPANPQPVFEPRTHLPVQRPASGPATSVPTGPSRQRPGHVPTAPPPMQPQSGGVGPTPIPTGGVLPVPKGREGRRLQKQQAKHNEKLARQEVRRIARQLRWSRISNFFRGLIRGLFGMLITFIATSLILGSLEGRTSGQLQGGDQALVIALSIVGFFVGVAIFPWPRRRLPNFRR